MIDRQRILLGLSALLLSLCAFIFARADDPTPPSRADEPAPKKERADSRNPVSARDDRGPARDPRGAGHDARIPGRDDRGPGGPTNFGPSESRGEGPGQNMFFQRLPDGSPGPGARMMGGFPGGDPMRQIDPEMQRLLEADFSLDRDSHMLAESLRHAPKDKQDEVRKKLQETVNKQFEARQQRRTLELKRLETEIKRIRASIDKRNEMKQQIVEHRIAELLGQDDTSF